MPEERRDDSRKQAERLCVLLEFVFDEISRCTGYGAPQQEAIRKAMQSVKESREQMLGYVQMRRDMK